MAHIPGDKGEGIIQYTSSIRKIIAWMFRQSVIIPNGNGKPVCLNKYSLKECVLRNGIKAIDVNSSSGYVDALNNTYAKITSALNRLRHSISIGNIITKSNAEEHIPSQRQQTGSVSKHSVDRVTGDSSHPTSVANRDVSLPTSPPQVKKGLKSQTRKPPIDGWPVVNGWQIISRQDGDIPTVLSHYPERPYSYTIEVRYDDLRQHPVEIFNWLKSLNFKTVNYIKVLYLNADGRQTDDFLTRTGDEPGYRREFISSLLRGLITKCLTDAEPLVFENDVDEAGSLPEIKSQIRSTNGMEEIRGFELIGMLIGYCAKLRSDESRRFVIGNLFSPKLFKMLSIFLKMETDSLFSPMSDDIITRLYKTNNPEFSMYVAKSWKDLHQRNLENLPFIAFPAGRDEKNLCFFHPNGSVNLEGVKSNFDEIQRVLQQQLLERAQESRTIPAILAMARGVTNGMRGDSDNLKEYEALRQMDPEEMRLSIQGNSVAAETIISALNVKHEHLQRWLSDHKNDRMQLKNFLQAVTGAPALSHGSQIQIEVNGRWPKTHRLASRTCFQILNLPDYKKDDYMLFQKSLEEFILNALHSGY